MKGVNKVTLLGHLGKDPEIRSTQTGMSIANVSIATTERYKKQGELQEQTEWHRLVFWDKLADIAEKYLHKGSKLYVEGKLRTRNFDKDGQTHYMTEVHVQDLVMLDGKEQSGSRQQQSSYGSPAYGSQQSAISSEPEANEDDIDDVPF